MTDDSGKLTGVVPRARLLAVLGEPMTPAEAPKGIRTGTTATKKVASV